MFNGFLFDSPPQSSYKNPAVPSALCDDLKKIFLLVFLSIASRCIVLIVAYHTRALRGHLQYLSLQPHDVKFKRHTLSARVSLVAICA